MKLRVIHIEYKCALPFMLCCFRMQVHSKIFIYNSRIKTKGYFVDKTIRNARKCAYIGYIYKELIPLFVLIVFGTGYTQVEQKEFIFLEISAVFEGIFPPNAKFIAAGVVVDHEVGKLIALISVGTLPCSGGNIG